MARSEIMQFTWTETKDKERLKAYDTWREEGKSRIEFFRAAADALQEKADVRNELEAIRILLSQLVQSGGITSPAQEQIRRVVDLNIVEKLGL